MNTIYECNNCPYTIENPPKDCKCPNCDGELELIETKIHLPVQSDDEELTF